MPDRLRELLDELEAEINRREMANPFTAGAIEQLHEQLFDDDDDDEYAHRVGMEMGIDAYNGARGMSTEAPEPCGHHCPPDCPRCGEDARAPKLKKQADGTGICSCPGGGFVVYPDEEGCGECGATW